MLRTPGEIREAAAGLVERHAARLGMDRFAADMLVDVIRRMSLDDGQPDADGWIRVDGVKPNLPDIRFVVPRYVGEGRDEALAHRDGYGEAVRSIRWTEVIEYRDKRRAGDS